MYQLFVFIYNLMTVRMGYDLAKTLGSPKSQKTFWGEEEQQSERTFRACTEKSDAEFATTKRDNVGVKLPGRHRKTTFG